MAPPNRRGIPEVVEKRAAARQFNEALLGKRADGRTERRRKRLLSELTHGSARGGKRELKPIDVLSRVKELLDLGEPLAAIRKARPAAPAVEPTPEILAGIRRLHEAYAFPVEAYAFVGIDEAALRAAGVIEGPGLAKPPRPARERSPGLAPTKPRTPAGIHKARRGAA
jgi:hypothetical protein